MYHRLTRSKTGKKTVDPDTVPMGDSYLVTKTMEDKRAKYACHAVNKAIATKHGCEVVSFYSTPLVKLSRPTESEIARLIAENRIDHSVEAERNGWILRYDIPMQAKHVQTENNPKPF